MCVVLHSTGVVFPLLISSDNGSLNRSLFWHASETHKVHAPLMLLTGSSWLSIEEHRAHVEDHSRWALDTKALNFAPTHESIDAASHHDVYYILDV